MEVAPQQNSQPFQEEVDEFGGISFVVVEYGEDPKEQEAKLLISKPGDYSTYGNADFPSIEPVEDEGDDDMATNIELPEKEPDDLPSGLTLRAGHKLAEERIVLNEEQLVVNEPNIVNKPAVNNRGELPWPVGFGLIILIAFMVYLFYQLVRG